jgi:hypothetical protein
MNYTTAHEQFEAVLQFLQDKGDIKSSYEGALNAVKNMLSFKAKVEAQIQKNKTK